MNDSYRQYKQYTQYFADWIKKYSSDKYNKQRHFTNSLSALPHRVDFIIQNVSTNLSSKDLGVMISELPSILSYGKGAIRIRSLVHSIKVKEEVEVSSSSSSSSSSSKLDQEELSRQNEGHLNCIMILKKCHEVLEDWFNGVLRPQKQQKKEQQEGKEDAEVDKFTSISDKFAGLKLQSEDENEVEESNTENDSTHLHESVDIGNNTFKESIAEVDDLDSQFGDLRLRILCFFIDLISLDELIIKTWKRVKDLEISVFAATVATYSAIRQIQSTEAELSLHYPSYKSATHFMAAVETILLPKERAWIESQAVTPLFRRILSSLQAFVRESFKSPFPQMAQVSCLRTESFYNECTASPLKIDDELILCEFIVTEIRYLLNSFLAEIQRLGYKRFIRKFTHEYKDALTPHFVRLFVDFFSSRIPTMTLNFLVLCWIRSVQGLEDPNNLFMYKTIYLCRSWSRKRSENFSAMQEAFNVLMEVLPASSIPTGKLFQYLREQLAKRDNCLTLYHSWNIVHNNPYLAAATAIDEIFVDHTVMSGLMDTADLYHRFILYFYSTFKQKNLFSAEDEIPCLDAMLAAFDQQNVYNSSSSGSRNTRLQGSYLTEYCLLKGFPIQLINKIKENGFQGSMKDIVKHYSASKTRSLTSLKEMNFTSPEAISPLFAAVMRGDYSKLLTVNGFMGSEMSAVNSTEMINILIHQMEKELFETRYLSMDMLAYACCFFGFHAKIVVDWPDFGVLSQKYVEIIVREMISIDKALIDDLSTSAEVIANQFCLLDDFFDYCDHPDLSRSASADMVEVFCSSLSDFFNYSIFLENIWIIPKCNSLYELYEKEFGSSFTSGMLPFPEKPPTMEQFPEGEPQTYFNLIKKCRKTIDRLVTDEDKSNHKAVKLALKKEVKDYIRNKGKHVLLLEWSRPLVDQTTTLWASFMSFYSAFHGLDDDSDMGEWLFVTYACHSYVESQQPYFLYAAQNGVRWAFDLFFSVSSVAQVCKQLASTGDTVLHVLAKNDHEELLRHLVSSGIFCHLTNNDGRTFIYYVKNRDLKEGLQRLFDIISPIAMKMVESGERVELKRPTPLPLQYDSETIRNDLHNDVILHQQQHGRFTSTNGGKKKKLRSIETMKEVTQEDEEKAKEAERMLLEILDKEEENNQMKKNKQKNQSNGKKPQQQTKKSKK